MINSVFQTPRFKMHELRVHYAVIVVPKLIYSFTVLNYGPKKLVSPAVLRMPEPFMRSIYAKITFWRQDFTCVWCTPALNAENV